MVISIYHSFDLIFIDLFLISGKEHIKHHIKKIMLNGDEHPR